MNDPIIRNNFHRKILRKQHADNNTLVIDELGLNHGENRADIAVVNGLLVGYEIKSNNDSLIRLKEQIISYNAIFDKAFIIVGSRHCKNIHKYLPRWWGIIIANNRQNSTIKFKVIRKSYRNKNIYPISIARLLWRNEVIELLKQKHIPPKLLQQPRIILYETLVNILNINELRRSVREILKKRKNWRCPEPLSQYDGLSQPDAT